MTKQFKILISAYACEPDKGSEPEVGWQWALQLARFNHVWVLTRTNNKTHIEASKATERYQNLHFIYCDLPKYISWWKKGQRGVHLYYVLWQIFATVNGYKLHRKIKFDFCHHLTFSPFYQPPFLSLLPIPFIWGPLGGGEKLPFKFLRIFQKKYIAREVIRILIKKLALVNPVVIYAMVKSKIIISSTHETYKAIPKIFRNKVVKEMQIGMSQEDIAKVINKENDEFTLITAGRQNYWKAHILIIQAFAQFLKKNHCVARLKIIGRGSENFRLKSAVKELGIENSVVFIPFLPKRSDVLLAFSQADVFIYSSLLECAGYVVLEALSQGTPVICLNLPGPGEIVNGTCGITVSCDCPTNTIKNISNAIEKLYYNEQLLDKMTKSAPVRVKSKYYWPTKGERLQSYLIETFCKKNIQSREDLSCS